MEYKKLVNVFVILFLAVLLVGALSSARDFSVYNSSNSAENYFVVNGTTGNVDALNNVSAQWFFGNFTGNVSGNFTGNSSIWSRAGSYVFPTNIGDYLGIGTTSPSYALDVSGSIRATGDIYLNASKGIRSLYNGEYILRDFNNSNIILAAAGGNLYLGYDNAGTPASTNNVLLWSDLLDASAYKLIDRNGFIYQNRTGVNNYFAGNVGIGTTSPQKLLHVSSSGEIARLQSSSDVTSQFNDGAWNTLGFTVTGSTTNNYAGIGFADSAGGAAVTAIQTKFTNHTNDYGELHLSTRGASGIASRLVIDSSGQVGIGTTTPGSYRLNVQGGSIALGVTSEADVLAAFNTHTYLKAPNGNIYFQTPNANTRAYIDSTGNFSVDTSTLFVDAPGNRVGIGTTTPSYPLDVVGDVNAYNFLVNGSAVATAASANVTSSGSANYVPVFTSSSNLGNSQIYQNGNNIGIGTTGASGNLEVASSGTTYGFITSGTDAGEYATLQLRRGGSGNRTIISRLNSDHGTYPDATYISNVVNGSTVGYFAIMNDGDVVTGSNVGIGTSSPVSALDVESSTNNVIPSLSSSPGGSVFFSNTGNTVGLSVGVSNSNEIWLQGRQDTGTGSAFALSLQPKGGNVGIGTTSPGVKLEVGGSGSFGSYVNSTSDNSVYLGLKNSVNDWRLNTLASSGAFTLYDNTGGTTPLTVENGASSNTLYLDSTGYVGIGTTSPTSLLHLNGSSPNIAIEATGAGQGKSVTFLSNGDKYNWRIGADYTVGNAITITPSTAVGGSTYTTPAITVLNGGNVGIGTTSPSYKLDVNGTGDTRIGLRSGTDNLNILVGAGDPGIGTFSDDNFRIITNSSTKLTLLSGGNFGIGTTNPQEDLHVAGNGQALINNDLLVGGTSGGANGRVLAYTSGGSNTVLLKASGDSYLTGGNVGIGITNPSYLLTVSGTSAPLFNINRTDNGNSEVLFSNTLGSIYAGISGAATSGGFAVGPNADLSSSPWLFINRTSGNVGIGTTGPNMKLDVKASSGSTALAGFKTNDWTLSSAGSAFYIESGAASGNTYTKLSALSAGDTAWNNLILQSGGGNVGIGTTSPQSTLDVAGTINNSGVVYASYRTYSTSAPLLTVGDNQYGLSSSSGNLYFQNLVGGGNFKFQNNSGTGTVVQVEGDTGRVGIGTTTPSYPLDVVGDVNAYNFLVNGSAVATAASANVTSSGSTSYIPKFTSSTNIGNSIIYDTGGIIGIGTTSPSGKLTVAGDIYTNDSSRGARLGHDGFGSGNRAFLILDSDSTDGIGVGSDYLNLVRDGNDGIISNEGTAGDLFIKTGGSNRVVVDGSTGYVGVGTTTPSYTLSIESSSNNGLAIHGPRPALLLNNTNADNKTWSLQSGYNYGLEINEVNTSASDYNTRLYIANGTGNVGIGTTNPGYQLDVVGNLQLSNDGPLINAYSTNGASGFRINVANVTGATNDLFRIQDSGTTVINVKKSGNVGIGTTSPVSKLTIQGVGGNSGYSNPLFLVNSTSSFGGLTVAAPSGQNTFYEFYEGGSKTAGLNYDASNNYLDIHVQGASDDILLRPGSSGQVGIGTTSPVGKLHVVTTGDRVAIFEDNDAPSIYLNDSGNSADQKLAGLRYGVGGTRRFDIASSNDAFTTQTAHLSVDTSTGYVGINNTSPGTALDVIGSTTIDGGGSNKNLVISNDGSYTYLAGSGNFWITPQTNGAVYFNPGNSGFVQVHTGDLRVASGNVGVGTTSTTHDITLGSTDAVIASNTSDAADSSQVTIAGGGAYGDSRGGGIQLNGNEVSGNGGRIALTAGNVAGGTIQFNVAGSERARINATTGYFGIGTTNPGTRLTVDAGSTASISSFVTTPGATKRGGGFTGDDSGNGRAILWLDANGGDFAGGDYFYISQESGTNGTDLIVQNAAPLGFFTAGTQRVTISSGGLVGIGTTSPQNALQIAGSGTLLNVSGSSGSTRMVVADAAHTITSGYWSSGNRIETASAPFYIGTGDASNLYLRTSGNDRLTILSSGLVGIGTTSPSEDLQVEAASAGVLINSTSGNALLAIDAGSGQTPYVSFKKAGSESWEIGPNTGGLGATNTFNLYDVGAGSARISVTTGGLVGINNTSPNQLLTIGDGSGGSNIELNSNGAGSYINFDSTGYDLKIGHINTVSSFQIGNTSNNAIFVSVPASSGYVGIGTTSPGTKLEVSDGDVRVLGTAAGTDRYIALGEQGATGNASILKWDATNDVFKIYGWGAGASDQDDFVVDSINHRVGIGVTSPGYKLHLAPAEADNIGGLGIVSLETGNYRPVYVESRSPYGSYFIQAATSFTSGEAALTADANGFGDSAHFLNGNVGIGTTSPARPLSVNASGSDVARFQGTSGYIDVDGGGRQLSSDSGLGLRGTGSGTADLYITSTGLVGINNTSPGEELYVTGDINATGDICVTGGNCLSSVSATETDPYWTANYSARTGTGNVVFSASPTLTGTLSAAAVSLSGDLNLNSNSITNVNKITANTVDPVYTIEGNQYATFLPGMVGGPREEVSGTVDLKKGVYTIDFNKLEVGSNLYVFYHATTFGKQMESLQIALTAGFDGRVWYTKDAKANTLTIHGSSDGEVSYRFTADRFDNNEWSTLLVNATTTGLIAPQK